ncbi:hypothetical protein LWI29_025304 [Acer saccharum]|uniref:Uncharacterized protein n=1 Tax=Acer saccharum TaxID=4024 RepID=A0AA39W8Z1_ACESA|nr:hypothetical protein LWI29_025304 [Acer saccharum]
MALCDAPIVTKLRMASGVLHFETMEGMDQNFNQEVKDQPPCAKRDHRSQPGAVPDAAFGAPESDAGSQQNNIADGPVEKGNRYIDMENLVMGKKVQVPVPVSAPQFNIHHILHRLKVGRP